MITQGNSMFRQLIAGFLLLTISFFVIPKEVFHDLNDHQDTECVSHSGYHFEETHLHCQFLEVETVFDLPCFSFLSFSEDFTFLKFKGTSVLCETSSLFNLSLLRAPPGV